MSKHPEPGTLSHRDFLVQHLCSGLKVAVDTQCLPDWKKDVRTMFEAVEAVRAANVGRSQCGPLSPQQPSAAAAEAAVRRLCDRGQPFGKKHDWQKHDWAKHDLEQPAP